MKKILATLLKVLCGDFSGIQVFWSPGTLLYLLSGSGILAALSSGLGFRIHYMPLFIFFIMLFYVLFIACKMLFLYPIRSGDLLDEFISLNISVLGLFLISLIIYAISAFMNYFYGIDGTLKPILLFLFKAYTAALIYYHYLLSLWLKPYYQRAYGRKRAQTALLAYCRKNKFPFLRFSLLILMLVWISIRLYQILISWLLSPVVEGLTSITGLSLQLQMRAFYDMGDIVINILILILAVLISNIIFYPLVFAVNHVAHYLMPIHSHSGKKHA